MTVCIAAIHSNHSILGASDRMVTGGYGDITFEPPIPKILPLTTSITLLTAGDQNIQIQLYHEIRAIIDDLVETDPNHWLDVSEVVKIYSKCYLTLRNSLIEKYILSPYNLTFDSFYTRQKEMTKEFIDTILMSIARFDIDYMRDRAIETIITGIDNSGPHIYVVANGEVSCHDKLGFAAIGIGSSHAVSHFMLSAYSKVSSEAKAVLTVHQAKKKAEVSPGVGKETDMFTIGPRVGTFYKLEPLPESKDIVKDLDNFYKKYTAAITKFVK